MTCHGRHATGSDQGPPLVHRIYEPNHHADIAFRLAVRNGVRAHHWPFGNMAPVEGVSDEDAIKITRYVRELQKAQRHLLNRSSGEHGFRDAAGAGSSKSDEG